MGNSIPGFALVLIQVHYGKVQQTSKMSQVRLGYSHTATAGHCSHLSGNLCLQKTKVAGLPAPREMRAGTWDPASQGCASSREASLRGACSPGAATCFQHVCWIFLALPHASTAACFTMLPLGPRRHRS